MNNCPTCGSSTFTMKNWRFETVPDKVFLEYDEVVRKIHEVEARGLEAINEMHKARLRLSQQENAQAGSKLWDMYAAAALPAVIGGLMIGHARTASNGEPITEAHIAEQTAEFVDAMLAERDKRIGAAMAAMEKEDE